MSIASALSAWWSGGKSNAGKVATGDATSGVVWATPAGGAPSGAAGGALTGTYPNPMLDPAAAAANRTALSLGTAATQASSAFDAAGAAAAAAAASEPLGAAATAQAAAIAFAASSAAALYVPLTDSRLSDARAPTSHATSHESRGADRVTAERLIHESPSRRCSRQPLTCNDRRRK